MVNLGGKKLDENALESKGAAEMISELAADVTERVESRQCIRSRLFPAKRINFQISLLK